MNFPLWRVHRAHRAHRTHRAHRAFWTSALALVLLWMALWGQVHRVWHAGTPLPLNPVAAMGEVGVAAAADTHQAVPGLHDGGGGLCQLLDQLSHGPGVTTNWVWALPSPVPMGLPVAEAWGLCALHRQTFQARGPPPAH